MFVCVYQGKSRDKVGLFPANFVQRVRPGERVWKVTAGFHGNRDKGQMTVKEAQVDAHIKHAHRYSYIYLFIYLFTPSDVNALNNYVCKFMQKTAEITEDGMLWLPMRLTFSLSPQTLSHYWMSLAPPPPNPNHLSSLAPYLPPSPSLPLQICVGKNEEIDGFFRLSSGKKRGLVPMMYLLEIWWQHTSPWPSVW